MGGRIIKVCGMREPENIRQLAMLDIDLMGFIFYPASSRYVLDDKECIDAICRCGKRRVGVFVNETVENMLNKAETYKLNYLQLHGNETPEVCNEVRQHGYSVIKVFSVALEDDLKNAGDYVESSDYFLFDTKCSGYGGSGKRFDWSILDKYTGNLPFLLSGGLAPGCTADIGRLTHPLFAGVDINSGFELSPALKDVVKIQDFAAEVRHIWRGNNIV